MRRVDSLLTGAMVVTPPASRRGVYGRRMNELVIIADGAVAIHAGRIVEIGTTAQMLQRFKSSRTLNAGGRVLTPGLVDPHTHLVFAGDRAHEFEMKIQGATYLDIAKAGGGILSTVNATRTASATTLFELATQRLNRMAAHGVTTAEVKSGYGLSWAGELKMLEVIQRLRRTHPLDIVSTFLGAHALPKEFKGRRRAYVHLLTRKLIPHVAKHRLAEFCDVFSDLGAFTTGETREIFEAASQCGMALKLHAHEFSRNGGVELAGRCGAVSADHLLQCSAADIQSMRDYDVVPVTLPGTPFGLGMKTYAPARAMIDAGLRVALGSDCNPGTSYSESLPLMMTLACTQMRMTPAEALTAATINAAAAIGRAHRIGTLEPNKQADLVLWDTTDYRHIAYHYGINLVMKVMKRGSWIFSRDK